MPFRDARPAHALAALTVPHRRKIEPASDPSRLALQQARRSGPNSARVRPAQLLTRCAGLLAYPLNFSRILIFLRLCMAKVRSGSLHDATCPYPSTSTKESQLFPHFRLDLQPLGAKEMG